MCFASPIFAFCGLQRAFQNSNQLLCHASKIERYIVRFQQTAIEYFSMCWTFWFAQSTHTALKRNNTVSAVFQGEFYTFLREFFHRNAHKCRNPKSQLNSQRDSPYRSGNFTQFFKKIAGSGAEPQPPEAPTRERTNARGVPQ